MDYFTKREREQAKKARDLYAMVGYPSTQDFVGMIKHNMIGDCNITTQNILDSKTIYGLDIFALKGKTVQKSPVPVTTEYVNIPVNIF